MTDAVLALNAGSSSIKFALFERGTAEPVAAFGGQVEGIGSQPCLKVAPAGDPPAIERRWSDLDQRDHHVFIEAILTCAEGRLGGDRIVAFSHRVAHGGPHFRDPLEISASTL